MTQNRSKPWAIAFAFCSKTPKIDDFAPFINNSCFKKRCENDPKSIKTMGRKEGRKKEETLFIHGKSTV